MSAGGKFSSVLKRSFVSGVLVVVPLILTYIVLRFLFESIDGVLRPLLEHVLGYYVPGLGIITTLCLIILAGVLTRNILGAQMYILGERLLTRMPVIRPVYSAAKQLLEAVALPSTDSFKEVVIVEYPRRGSYAIGFVTGRMELNLNGESRHFVSVFVPSTPTPVSGFVLLVPADEAIKVNMTVEDGVKFLVSGGVASPDRMAEVTV
jgi:uncharacterized membrane protein